MLQREILLLLIILKRVLMNIYGRVNVRVANLHADL